MTVELIPLKEKFNVPRELSRFMRKVAEPNEMVAAQILVALVEPPRNRQAGDGRPREGRSLVRCQHRGADPIAVQVGRSRRAIERQQLLLPSPPALDVATACRLEPVLQARQRAMSGLFRAAAEPEREQGTAAVGRKVDFAAQCDIAVLGAAIALIERVVPG